MTFELDVAGVRRTAQVERRPDGTFHVVLDGQPIDVDVQQTDLGLSLVYAADGRSLDGAAVSRPNGEWLVHLPHVDVPVVVDGQRHARRGAGAGAAAGEQRVTAPMPGRVVRVLVAIGDEVAHRQGLVVVEAMKMENELVSPKAGRVKDVVVGEGISVEAGRLLIVIE
jgi:biotin carboxyl carrier protein